MNLSYIFNWIYIHLIWSVDVALPTPVAPSTSPASGNWIALISGYIKDGSLVLGLAIAAVGFLWVAYVGFAKFNEARQGKSRVGRSGRTRRCRRRRINLRQLSADRSIQSVLINGLRLGRTTPRTA